MRLLPCGDVGLLVELADLEEVLALYRQLAEAGHPGVVELVPASRTLLVQVDPAVTTTDAVARLLGGLDPRPDRSPAGPEVELPVVYDGEDLAEVGELTGLGTRGVVDAHTVQRWPTGTAASTRAARPAGGA